MVQWQKVLVVMAHPDDADVHCGGTIAKLVRLFGTSVVYIVCTSGDKGNLGAEVSPYQLAEHREGEQLAAADVLGVQRVIYLRHPDGELSQDKALRDEIALLIRHFKPDVVFTHDPWRFHQLHPDHRVVGFTTVDAVIAARDNLFLPAQTAIGLEAYAPLELMFFRSSHANQFEDISGFMDTKLEALRQHESQMQPWSEWKERVVNRAVEAGREIGVQYAEPFKRFVLRGSNRERSD